MSKVLEISKELIDYQLRYGLIEGFATNKEVSKFFMFSNEKIASYLQLCNITGCEKTLTVTGSGDQIFSLLSQGIINIDTFDVNLLAEYYVFGLKKALIIRYNYPAFCKIMHILSANALQNGSINELVTQIIFDSLSVMDFPFQDFWRRILDYNWQIQNINGKDINIMKLLGIINVDIDFYLANNSYLQNEAAYNKMRANLFRSNISFKLNNAVNLGQSSKKKYDLICLSNVLDFVRDVWKNGWDYSKLKEYLASLDTITNPGSLIVLHYIFDYNPECELFDSSNVYLKDLKDLEVQVLPEDSFGTDAVIFKRQREK